jgi:probable F420-dependent oxidoreductase
MHSLDDHATSAPAERVPPPPFKFGVGAPRVLDSRQALVEHVRFLDSEGFDTATFPDHLYTPLAPIVTWTVAAEVSDRLTVAPFLLAAGLRNPVLLAKELASSDLLSGGRLEVGIGAGWNPDDYEPIDIQFDRPGARVRRLEETAQILRASWQNERLTFEGEFYTIREAICASRTFTEGGPPLIIGGGMPKVLAVAGRQADIVTIAGGALGKVPAPESAEGLRERIGWVRAAAESVGRTPELHMLLSTVTVCTDRRIGAQKFCDQAATHGVNLSVEDVLASPFVAIGSVAQITEQLRYLRAEFGVGYFTVPESVARDLVPVVHELSNS